uniref:Uncharacterized protein n=1 Tax=Arundo donax TaxID=35708 RepID=A0A0A9EF73_ARUDO
MGNRHGGGIARPRRRQRRGRRRRRRRSRGRTRRRARRTRSCGPSTRHCGGARAAPSRRWRRGWRCGHCRWAPSARSPATSST